MRCVSPLRKERLRLACEEGVQHSGREILSQIVIATVEDGEVVLDEQQNVGLGCRSVHKAMMARRASIDAAQSVWGNPAGVDSMTFVEAMVAQTFCANHFVPGLHGERNERWTDPNAMFETVAVATLHD